MENNEIKLNGKRLEEKKTQRLGKKRLDRAR